MQQQLNDKIQQLKNSGKQGRQLSEELAEMAAEQERIRRALQQMQEKMKQEGSELPGGDLPDKMEDTEIDLVNKQPKAVEEYLRIKEKEVELLKTVPPKLYPFYKKEVNDYFRRMRETKPLN
jgi:hypothetical protein